MDPEEKSKARTAKIKAIKKWPKRIEKLKTRKKEPLFQVDFCKKYDISLGNLNRCKFLTKGNVVRDEFFDKVEAALNAEKV